MDMVSLHQQLVNTPKCRHTCLEYVQTSHVSLQSRQALHQLVDTQHETLLEALRNAGSLCGGDQFPAQDLHHHCMLVLVDLHLHLIQRVCELA